MLRLAEGVRGAQNDGLHPNRAIAKTIEKPLLHCIEVDSEEISEWIRS